MTSRRAKATLAIALLSASCATAKPPIAQQPMPMCGSHETWLMQPPSMTAERVYGIGSAASRAVALDLARADAAKTIGVQVQEDATDTQVLWRDDDRTRQRSEVTRAARSLVDRRLESCQQADLCRGEQGQLHVLVSCDRATGLERALLATAARWATLEAPMRVLAVPGTDADGFITQLGLYMVNVLRDQLAARNHSLAIVDAGPWRPSELHEAARKAQATHLLRVEYLTVAPSRISATAYLQDAESDQRVPASTSTFEVQLDEGQSSLLAERGSLLPQRAAQNLVGIDGGFHVPLTMSRTDLQEGDAIDFRFRLPRAGYVYLFDLYEDGSAAMFIPSPLVPDNHFASGVEVSVPSPQRREQLLACALRGQAVTREYLKLLILPTPLSTLQPLDPSTLRVLHGGPNGELDRVVNELNAQPSEERGSGELAYNIRRSAAPPPACRPQH